jgi:hypothetical protein
MMLWYMAAFCMVMQAWATCKLLSLIVQLRRRIERLEQRRLIGVCGVFPKGKTVYDETAQK